MKCHICGDDIAPNDREAVKITVKKCIPCSIDSVNVIVCGYCALREKIYKLWRGER